MQPNVLTAMQDYYNNMQYNSAHAAVALLGLSNTVPVASPGVFNSLRKRYER